MSGIKYTNLPGEIIEQIASYSTTRDLANLEVADSKNNSSVIQAAKQRAEIRDARDASKIQGMYRKQTDWRIYDFFNEYHRGAWLKNRTLFGQDNADDVNDLLTQQVRNGLSRALSDDHNPRPRRARMARRFQNQDFRQQAMNDLYRRNNPAVFEIPEVD
ncbi:hypothetical protein [Nereida ignava]|uniref:hypothetical protein n=1 Tax=Nereida ignava TaxID=282199 RepID=UPI0030FAE338